MIGEAKGREAAQVPSRTFVRNVLYAYAEASVAFNGDQAETGKTGGRALDVRSTVRP